MRCNACWRELEGQAISTTCGHLLCTEDAKKILSSDAACPICDQVLSKRYWGCWLASNNVVSGKHEPLVLSSSVICQAIAYYPLMKPVDINPNDEWINMAMAGISPQILMKSACRSVMFFIGQKELEMQFKFNKIVGQCRQKCEAMQEKFTEKLEQLHSAYQKMAKRCKMLEQETESLTKDKQELQEKFSEKSRQKRKLDEMYDQLRSEYESMKRSAIQPASNCFARAEPDLFSSPVNMMDNRRDTIRKDWLVFSPKTPGTREDIWPSARQKSSNSGPFDVSVGSPAKQTKVYGGAGNQGTTHPLFSTHPSNPATTIRNLMISPMKRPQLSRRRADIFTS